jgi:hypothetical protein
MAFRALFDMANCLQPFPPQQPPREKIGKINDGIDGKIFQVRKMRKGKKENQEMHSHDVLVGRGQAGVGCLRLAAGNGLGRDGRVRRRL